MKCPKCGFNSFEYYDSCKKCSADLTGYKQTYSIASVVLPSVAKEHLVAESQTLAASADNVSEKVEMHEDIFSFDLPNEPLSPVAEKNDDPFNFDEPEPVVTAAHSGTSGSDADDFANLLESTSQTDESPFASVHAPTPVSFAATQANAGSSPGEFDLESFSWDETPAETASDIQPDELDDFDSLFGDTKENSFK
ncbi:MAG: hypothetical protein PHN84_09875 [Desulfuromonadaceae bacterium]|nr:hypothetical protein [Desulfuromonadaceae bacterium]MDD2856663.1 hypothetical protein [Desulfuromonadaceae bacterium]